VDYDRADFQELCVWAAGINSTVVRTAVSFLWQMKFIHEGGRDGDGIFPYVNKHRIS
jgi:hypothetical protein